MYFNRAHCPIKCVGKDGPPIVHSGRLIAGGGYLFPAVAVVATIDQTFDTNSTALMTGVDVKLFAGFRSGFKGECTV